MTSRCWNAWGTGPWDGRALPFVRHRWTSRLSLLRAGTLTELLLETEPEWRLYEDLRAAGLDVRIHADRRIRPAGPEEQESRAWLITPAGSARFADTGFEVDLCGTRELAGSIGQVLTLLTSK